MTPRKIIKIDEDKCNGCGLCVPGCAEGAIQIISGKAKLVKDSYCDGLGACLGHCPNDALHIIERDADEFDEEAATEHMNKIKAAEPAEVKPAAVHSNAPSHQHAGGGCPGSRMMMFGNRETKAAGTKAGNARISNDDIEIRIKPQLRQWPVQLSLVPVRAPYFEGADLLVTADCVPFAYADYHRELLKGRTVVVGCPKLDDAEAYTEKLAEIFQGNYIKSVTVAHMEVPCCSGIVRAVINALSMSGKDIPVTCVKVGINGEAEYR